MAICSGTLRIPKHLVLLLVFWKFSKMEIVEEALYQKKPHTIVEKQLSMIFNFVKFKNKIKLKKKNIPANKTSAKIQLHNCYKWYEENTQDAMRVYSNKTFLISLISAGKNSAEKLKPGERVRLRQRKEEEGGHSRHKSKRQKHCSSSLERGDKGRDQVVLMPKDRKERKRDVVELVLLGINDLQSEEG